MTNPSTKEMQQLLAVTELTASAERAVLAGVLPEQETAELRARIRSAYLAFDLPVPEDGAT